MALRGGAGKILSALKIGVTCVVLALVTVPALAVIPPVKFMPRRLKPVFPGEFKVNLVVIAFPDTEHPDPRDVCASLSRLDGGFTVTDYYREFSHHKSWPVLQVYPELYLAPQPKGYYCRHDMFRNPIGFRDAGEGRARGDRLRREALAFAKRQRGAPRGQVEYYVFCTRLDEAGVRRHLRGVYPAPKNPGERDRIADYQPRIPWLDPLWPMSIPQGHYPGGSRTLVHELGHVLGAPDYYHATEEYDGVAGTPALPWSYGPTGMAYNRCIYYGFVPVETYPVFREPGVYTLDPRSSPLPGDPGTNAGTPLPKLGCFIPSAHPNYIFCVEYVHGEKPPVGQAGAEGLLVHVINVTFSSPFKGPPDLCYTYRAGDPYLKGTGVGNAYLQEGDIFHLKSDPASILPPLIPSGMAICNIRMRDGKCTFELKIRDRKMSPAELKAALKPRIALTGVDEVLPTSFRAHCDVRYRGEPLLTEYGFCWGTAPHPTVGARNRFPLYHRDRYDGRILGLKSRTKYYVRAYAMNAIGVDYSAEEKTVTTPAATEVKEVPPLLTDRYAGNSYITRRHSGVGTDMYFHSANAMIAFTSLGAYYRTLLGTPAKDKPKGKDRKDRKARRRMDFTRVHVHPADTRPKFRMVEYGELYDRMSELAKRAGFREHVFGDMKAWIRRAAKELGVKAPAKSFFPVENAEALKAHESRIRLWLLAGRPVMFVRENSMIEGVTDVIYPLDIAIIDGVSADGDYHVYYPLGHDRAIPGSGSGYVKSETLFTSVVKGCLVFYAPEPPKNKKR